jgi:23S rRNA (cytidine2498-2'-O)-methyltransferase
MQHENVYLAPHQLSSILKNELLYLGYECLFENERFFWTKGICEKSHWAQSHWSHPQIFEFESIKNASNYLRTQGKFWAYYHLGQNVRRGQLIQEQLAYFKTKPLLFLDPLPSAPIGAWTLLSEKKLLASPVTQSVFPLGEMTFLEDHTNPPSRAYLKLWEFFTLYSPTHHPLPTEHVLDLGAAPGSWSWVLRTFGCDVTSIDRAPLELPPHPQSRHHLGNAFALKAKDLHRPLDWVFSDIICYPEKLADVYEYWLQEGVNNFVFTFKFQGEIDVRFSHQWQKKYGGQVVHLHHNKHELTWFKLASQKEIS